MKTDIHIMDPKAGEVTEDNNQGTWVEIGGNADLYFDSREDAISFFETGRDKVIEGGNDE